MDLEAALEQFDATEANLRRLEDVLREMERLIPTGIAFVGASAEGRRYRELSRAYRDIVAGIPSISGYKIGEPPIDLDTLAQWRLDADEVGEISAVLQLNDELERPQREIDEYKYRFENTRRSLVRQQLGEISREIDSILQRLTTRYANNPEPVADPDLDRLVVVVRQVERLAGGQIPRGGAWSDLQRHLRFHQGHDLHDIMREDWPSVRDDLRRAMYTELEPIPVKVNDLAELSESHPAGPVTSELDWTLVSDELFERLVFNLIGSADGYENARWLTETNAPDRGRDLSAERVRRDSLTGVWRERVIIQARNWRTRSVGIRDVSSLVAQAALWEPPVVDVLIIATSGRFTTDGVDWIERRNTAGKRPRIEMWPESHMELLLARRPELAAALGITRAPHQRRVDE